jgi:hypothetical protein
MSALVASDTTAAAVVASGDTEVCVGSPIGSFGATACALYDANVVVMSQMMIAMNAQLVVSATKNQLHRV